MENSVLKTYLKEKEVAVFELMAKYEKSKTVIEGYKQNEEILDKHIDTVQKVFEKIDEKYESLKKHAFAQVEKYTYLLIVYAGRNSFNCRANTDMNALHSDYEKKLSKQVALMKGIEIKYNCLMHELNDKTQQCSSIEALISEITDKV